ncbi:polysaccharide lyase family 7 protein [Granulosicoccus sp. 3-233]|uniref:polysaccharide lyase family 7 protein n=1 Tax=Granulosicoccus sp. 3-233 TaxID=3417969 RepID=UPI003D34711F
MIFDRKGTSVKLLLPTLFCSLLHTIPALAQDAAIPAYITDGSIWELEGETPDPLINETSLQFLPLEAQVATANGNGWRHEYKIKQSERLPMAASYELFQATYTVSMSDGAKSIITQYHGDDPTLMKLYYADSTEAFVDGDGNPVGDSVGKNGIFDLYVRLRTKGLPDFGEDVFHFGTFVAGDTFDVSVENNYGTVTVTVDDLSVTREVEQTPTDYLKFGNYLQSQVTTDTDHPYGGDKCSALSPPLDFPECYEFLGIYESSVILTNVSYERIEDPDYELPPPEANAELLNGDFEDSLNDWIQQEPVSASGDVYTGEGSAKVGDAPGRIYQRVEVLPDTTYEFSAYVKGEGALGAKGTEGIEDTAEGEVDVLQAFDTSDWTAVSVTFTTGADPLPVYLYGLHGSSGDVRFDDMTLTAEDEDSSEPTSALNLRNAVYSDTAGEVFWDRITDGGNVLYEVTRNGELVGVLDALSVFDDDLLPGDIYTYTVSVVNADGEIISTEETSFVTGGDGSSGSEFPTGIRADVYSSTAAEIFWDRPDIFGLSYEIERNGELIALTDGVSFFDDTLSSGEDYEYRVVAIDAGGNRSGNFALISLTAR